MMRSLGSVLFILAGLPAVSLAVEETFCTGSEKCVDDVFSVRFTANNTSDLSGAKVGDLVEVNIQFDAKEPLIQGFSYGVKHDPAFLEIQSATFKGADPIITQGGGDVPPGADIKIVLIGQDKLGFVEAVIMTSDDQPPFELPVRDGIKVAIATYKVLAELPADGTKIAISNEIRPGGSPPTVTNISVNGDSRQPRKVNNAVLKGVQVEPCSAPEYAFYFGPSATGAAYDVPAGADQKVPISLRNKGAVLGLSLGIKRNGDALTFESTLGNPVVEMIVTKDDGKDLSGDVLKGNSAKGIVAANEMTRISKGAALAAITGDFFGSRILLSGLEGGPGATVGYVSDATGNGASIPAVTDAGAACGVNEVFIVQFLGGEVFGFSRGDGNGDGRITVTDGVIVAQNIFANRIVLFDCKDMLDINDDGALNTADPVYLLTYLFLQGPTPPAPFKACGRDPTNDALSCAQANCR